MSAVVVLNSILPVTLVDDENAAPEVYTYAGVTSLGSDPNTEDTAQRLVITKEFAGVQKQQTMRFNVDGQVISVSAWVPVI